MILTHDPFQPTPDSPDWNPATTGGSALKNVKHFGDMTAFMDALVGRVVARLDELGLRANTLLIFLGDNGTHVSVTSRFKGEAFKGGKGSTNSHVAHVPLVVSWPAVIKRGRVNALSTDAAAAKTKRQRVLDRFRDARPAELDRQFEAVTGVKKRARKRQGTN